MDGSGGFKFKDMMLIPVLFGAILGIRGQSIIYPDQFDLLRTTAAQRQSLGSAVEAISRPASGFRYDNAPIVSANALPQALNSPEISQSFAATEAVPAAPGAFAVSVPAPAPAPPATAASGGIATTPASPLVGALPEMWANHVNNIIARGVMKFSLDMDRAIYHTTAGPGANLPEDFENVVFSPLSLAATLAVVLLGSAGKTFEEVSKILGLESGVDISRHSEIVHLMFGLLLDVMNKEAQDLGPHVEFASGIFVQDGYPIRPVFMNVTRQIYHSEVINLDFQKHGKLAQDAINSWVSERTKGKIMSILPGVPDPATSVVIASALYFNGEWNQYFIDDATKRKPFFIENTQSVNVDMMYNGGEFPFYEDTTRKVKILGLPYKGLETTMYVLLPRAPGARALKDFENQLTPEILEDLIQKTVNRTCIIGFPRMKLSSSLSLNSALQFLGLKSLFNPQTADLSILSPGLNETLAQVPQFAPNLKVPLNQRTSNDAIRFPSRFGNDETENSQAGNGANVQQNYVRYETGPYNVEQWSNGFFIKKIHRRKRERSGAKSPVRAKRQNRPIDQQFLDYINSRNFPSYGLDALRRNPGLKNPRLFADEVVHKVEIDVTEKGTTAAASTAVLLERDGSQKRFVADRPFLFFIRHEPSKLLLFWGTVVKPTPNYGPE